MPVAELLRPDESFKAVAAEEQKLRPQYLQAETSSLRPLQQKELVEKSALILELSAAACCVAELYVERSWSPRRRLTPDEARDVVQRVRDRCGLDPVRVHRDARTQLRLSEGRSQPFELTLPGIVRAMRALLEICPLAQLEHIASQVHMESVGHRCRVAYDAVKAFVIRNDNRQKRIVTLLGQKYQEGALEVDDVAALLDVHPVDAVALLEETGFARPIDKTGLSDADRKAVYALMRADRLARNGEPSTTPELVGRHVVASERLEGIDARRWIPRDGVS